MDSMKVNNNNLKYKKLKKIVLALILSPPILLTVVAMMIFHFKNIAAERLEKLTAAVFQHAEKTVSKLPEANNKMKPQMTIHEPRGNETASEGSKKHENNDLTVEPYFPFQVRKPSKFEKQLKQLTEYPFKDDDTAAKK